MATLTATEQKLIWLALDRAATANEAEVAAAKLIRSLRQRGITSLEFCDPAVVKCRPKRDPGEVIMPFGRYRGQPIREIPEPYLRWAVNTIRDQERLINAIRQFLDTEVGYA